MIEDRSTANADPSGKTTYVFQDRAGKPGGGKGPLVSNGYYPTMTGHPFMMLVEEPQQTTTCIGNSTDHRLHREETCSHVSQPHSHTGIREDRKPSPETGTLSRRYAVGVETQRPHAGIGIDIMPCLACSGWSQDAFVAYVEDEDDE